MDAEICRRKEVGTGCEARGKREMMGLERRGGAGGCIGSSAERAGRTGLTGARVLAGWVVNGGGDGRWDRRGGGGGCVCDGVVGRDKGVGGGVHWGGEGRALLSRGGGRVDGDGLPCGPAGQWCDSGLFYKIVAKSNSTTLRRRK